MIKKRLIGIGNSTGLVIPQAILGAAGLRRGDEVEIALHGSRIVLQRIATKHLSNRRFKSAFSAVLEQYDADFQGLADYDAGRKNER